MRTGIALALAVLLASTAHSADDPTIPAEEKALVQKAMEDHIAANRVGEDYIIYDAVSGDLRRLRFSQLHAGVVRKGGFYVSCADFTTSQGTPIDVDFLVAAGEDGLRVLEPTPKTWCTKPISVWPVVDSGAPTGRCCSRRSATSTWTRGAAGSASRARPSRTSTRRRGRRKTCTWTGWI